jgi:DNA-binding NtrC family response regulator
MIQLRHSPCEQGVAGKAINRWSKRLRSDARWPNWNRTSTLSRRSTKLEDELISRTIAFAGSRTLAPKMLGLGRRTIHTRLENGDGTEAQRHANGRPHRNGRNGRS